MPAFRVSLPRLPWLLGLCGLTALVLVLAVALRPTRPTPAAAPPAVRQLRAVQLEELTQYAGNEACKSCHAEQFRQHAVSEHVRAVSRVDAASHGAFFRRPSEVRDPKLNLVLRTGVQDGVCVLTATGPGKQAVAQATYGFGSGKHGITYAGRQGEMDLELRLSYYPPAGRWAFSPGQQIGSKSGGMLMDTGLVKAQETVEGCFVCHTSVVGKHGDQLLPETAMLGVGCEACHGPAAAHVEAVRLRQPDLKMARLGSLGGRRVSTELCSQCHRSPAGEDLNDPFNRTQLPRLQGLALPLSPCYTRSEGKLSCLTCHDSHDQRHKSLAEYDVTCQSCHSGKTPEHPACPVQPRKDCVSCHMPAQEVGMPFNTRYRTHWIKVWNR